jgi:TolB-like protein/Tfp pilus assembly protein PilF
MNPRNFFAELKRRNVYKVALAYGIVGWLLIQIATSTFPVLEIPNWAIKLVIALVLLGFPIGLILAWAFELTPEGIKRADEVGPNESITPQTGRKLTAVIVVVAVIAAGLFAFQFVRTKSNAGAPGPTSLQVAPVTRAISEKSIAVLPFENLSDEKSNAYFADGIQDEILTRLAKVADLKVISRTSTQRFKSAPSDLREIARQLGVANILEGSVQRTGDQVRVNVQLINAFTDAHLWAEIYDRKLTDIFAVESEIAKTIADTLRIKLSGSEKTAMSKTPTANPEAYELYLKGRFFWNKRTSADLRRSIGYFEQAIEKDPNYALAYAALAQAWFVSPAYDNGTPKACFSQAEIAAKKALALDDNSSDAHAALGAVKQMFYFDTPGAIAEFERAIELNPNDVSAHHWLANHSLAASGQFERQLAEMKHARELDPLSLIVNTNLGWAYIYPMRLDEAIAQLRKAVEMDPNFYDARYSLGQALELKGNMADARAEYEKAISLSDDPYPLALLGHLCGSTGQRDEAQEILRKLEQARARGYVEAQCFTLVYLGLGQHEEALHSLEESYRERDGFGIATIRVDPFLRPLRGDPRFEALAEKIMPMRDFKGSAATAAK